MSIREKLLKLKQDAGNHSPSIETIKSEIPELLIETDFCFLSNPYASDLFFSHFKSEVLNSNKIRDFLSYYPSQNRFHAKNLSKAIGISDENIFVGNGAIEIIQMVLQNLVEKKIAIILPTFSSYYEFIQPDKEIIFYHLKEKDNFILNIDEYLNWIENNQPDTVVLINPNNPNGNYIKNSDILKILNSFKFVKNIIVDESFIHFSTLDGVKISSIAKYHEKYSNLIIIKSLSKDFGISGIRAGYAIMKKELIDKFLKNGYLWNTNGIAEYFFQLYGQEDFLIEYEKVRILFNQEIKEFKDLLKSINWIKVYPSESNFFLIAVENAEEIYFYLLENGLYVRLCDDKLGLQKNKYLRIAVRKKEENLQLIQKLKEYELARSLGK
mgnify:CR=1 FL=1